jgi:hypothetical protein
MVARRRIRFTKDTSRHAGRLFRWQRRRRSTEDAPREENEDLTEEEYDSRKTPHVTLADFFDGKEDEEAQKTLHARRTKISQEKNLRQREKGKTPQVTLTADLARWQPKGERKDIPSHADSRLGPMAKKTNQHRRRSARGESRSHRRRIFPKGKWDITANLPKTK